MVGGPADALRSWLWDQRRRSRLEQNVGVVQHLADAIGEEGFL
jgi:hypothetical protein